MDNDFDCSIDFNNVTNSSVVIIDDIVENIRLLNRMLKDAGFRTYSFQSGEEALQSLELYPPDIVLLDVNMPEMNGFEVARKMKEIPSLKDIPIIFVTAMNDVNSKVQAFSVGGVDYITKPFAFEEVCARVKAHLKIAFFAKHSAQYNAYLKDKLEQEYEERLRIQEKLIILHKNKFSAQMAVVEIMTGFVETNTAVLGRSIRRVQSLCGKICGKLMRNNEFSDILNEDFLDDIIYASALYDCGMGTLSSNLLGSKMKYTPTNRKDMEKHTQSGASILLRAKDKFPDNSMLKMAVELALMHHERFDGSGYPKGFSGTQIPLSVRILSVADVYDALLTDSGYRQRYTVKGAITAITNTWAKQFDPKVLEAFLDVINIAEEEEFLAKSLRKK